MCSTPVKGVRRGDEGLHGVGRRVLEPVERRDVSISFNPQKLGYLHDHFIGLNYEVNLSKPRRGGIENVTFQGKPSPTT